MKKVIFVSHCLLNTAAKVVLYDQKAIEAEEDLRIRFVSKLLNSGIQIIQLPCPEFTLYGPKRWGHVSEQFDHIFFRDHCREILKPFITQLKEYLDHPEFFKVLGIVGVDGSPSCGVDYTCSSKRWYGVLEQRDETNEIISTFQQVKGQGVFIKVLKQMLEEEGLSEVVKVTSLFADEPEKCLSLLD